MLDVESADAVVNAASRRVQSLDRFSRSAPIGRAELATVVLQGLAELGAHADWTVAPSVTNSVLHLMNDDERKRYEEFEAAVRRAAEKAGLAEAEESSMGSVSDPDTIEIDPAPSSDSRTASIEEVLADEELAARAAEAVVYQLYCQIVERAVLLVEHSPAARERLWPLVWAVAALIPPPDLSLRLSVEAQQRS
jgi:hypothetical protein